MDTSCMWTAESLHISENNHKVHKNEEEKEMKYEKPEMEVVELEKVDVITLSDGGSDTGDNDVTWGSVF